MEADVIVVGAGPVGLTLAGDLAAAGVRTTVLERRDSTESNLTRAFAVHARTLEELDARGLADELIATGAPARHFQLFGSVRVDIGATGSRYSYVLSTPQYNVERLLRRRAVAAGAQLNAGVTVTGLHQDADGVDVRTADGTTVRAGYVVGTDGVRSAVREALGLPFPGIRVLDSIILADVRLDHLPEDTLTLNATGDCFTFIAPYGDGWYRVFAWDRRNPQPDSAPVEIDEVRSIARRAVGTDLGMRDPRFLSRFHSDERQVPQYRVGRVFLAGDAAHVHSPAGGMGMNTGIQDAVNLGWKLAAAIHGWAPDRLLDSYHAERHPVGRQVVRISGTIMRTALLRSRLQRAARNTIAGTATRIGPFARRATGVISGTGIAYSAPRGAHPLVGHRAADTLLVAYGQPADRLYEVLRGGTFVLLARNEVATLAQPWADRLQVATPADPHAPVTLVRPDGYVAWAAQDPENDDLTRALAAHCGPPNAKR
ncbi:MAG: FAD-dependent monooxygenase [Micromonosporaceae bacterium]|nr:FAD-dependent monooxygenase [Micromonosporaceae bacterium]